MDELAFHIGVSQALDALLNNRLALLCGAGLSMAPPSSIPSAAALAESARAKYEATFGATRPPLPESIDDQANFFFDANELYTVYLHTYIDPDAFSAQPNDGHFSIADLMLIKGITTTVSTNVDTLIETAGNFLLGHIGTGVCRVDMLSLPETKAPLLKIHGCWSARNGTVWATNQLCVEPIMTRINESAQWLEIRLANRDLLVVGFSTDWDYLNQTLENCLGGVNPSRVIVVDPCATEELEEKAPVLFGLGRRATVECRHVRTSGNDFLSKLRVEYSRTFIRRILHSGKTIFEADAGCVAIVDWLEPVSNHPGTLWQIRRDLEGCKPNEPSKMLDPVDEPMIGKTLLQLQARGAVQNGSYWELDGRRIRVLRTPNQALHDVETVYSTEGAPATSPDIVVAVGAEAYSLPTSIARGSVDGSVVRGATIRWLSRTDAVSELDL